MGAAAMSDTQVSGTHGSPQGAPQQVSLRDALGAAPQPDFELVVPRGWQRMGTDAAGQSELGELLQARLMRAGRPDLHVGLKRMMNESFDQMRSSGAVAVFMPLDPDGKGQIGVATSITAVVRKSAPEASLDEYVGHVIRQYDAAPLFDDMRTLRFETEMEQELDGKTVLVVSVHYITPVPGSRRRRALELIATYGRSPQDSRTDDKWAALHAVFDLCASTLRWVPPKEAV